MEPTTEEALSWIRENKKFVDSKPRFPVPGEKKTLKAVAAFSRREFLMDVYRSQFTLNKITFQERAAVSVGLVRLDLDNKPHRNPNGTVLECPHLHIYQLGYQLAWAYPLNDPHVKSLNPSVDLSAILSYGDSYDKLKLFAQFCYFLNYPSFTDPEYLDGSSLFGV